jgi:hypothetical protein
VGTFTKQAYADLAAELHNAFPRLLATIRALQAREAEWCEAMPTCGFCDGSPPATWVRDTLDVGKVWGCDAHHDEHYEELPWANLIRKGAGR